MTPNSKYLLWAYLVPLVMGFILAADLFFGIAGGLVFEHALPVVIAIAAMPYTVARWAGRCWNCGAWASQAHPLFFWPARRCPVCNARLDVRNRRG